MKKLPAILISEENKRKHAKDEVRKAIKALKEYGPLAGISDRSMFELKSLTWFIEKELKRELRSEEQVGGSIEKRTIRTNERTTV